MPTQVLIVGGGVIGLSAAWYCTQRGLRVTLVERRGAARDGCSFGNAGMICPSHFVPLAAPGMVALGLKWMWNPKSPFYIKPRLDADLLSWGFKFWRASNARQVERAAPLLRDFRLASRAAFEAIAARPGVDFGLVKRGLIMLCKTSHAFDDEARLAERARALGIPAEVLDARQTAALDPGVTMDVVGSVHFPRDCHLTPDRFLATLQAEAQQAGATFLWDTEVTGWRTSGGRIDALLTSRGELTADDYVLCGGSWSPVVARDLGLRLPMQAGKGYSLTLPQPRQLPGLCAILTEARVAVTPMGSALRFGGTMEIAGHNDRVRPERIEQIISAAQFFLPEFTPADFAGIKPWFGYRPVSPDGLPYLGRFGRHPNLTAACGHAMLGVTMAPITGQIVSEILGGRKPSVDLSLLRPDRFA